MTTTEQPTSLIPTLPGQYYTDPAIFALEQSHVFEDMWFCSVRSSDLPTAGSFKKVTGVGGHGPKDFLVKKHASTRNYIFASDNKDELSEALDPAWKGPLPYTIIVDEKGNVIYREMGSINFLAMRRAIVPALNRLTPWKGLSPVKP